MKNLFRSKCLLFLFVVSVFQPLLLAYAIFVEDSSDFMWDVVWVVDIVIFFCLFVWLSGRKGIDIRRLVGSVPKGKEVGLLMSLPILIWLFSGMLLLAVACALAYFFPEKVLDFLAQLDELEPVAEVNHAKSIVHNVLLFIASVFLAPLSEELFFRGYLMHVFGRRAKIALFASAAVFGVAHGLFLFVPIFLSGLVLGIVYIRTRSLIATAFVHLVNNAMVSSIELYDLYNSITGTAVESSPLSLIELQDVGLLITCVVLAVLSGLILFIVLRKLWPTEWVLPYFSVN